MGTRPEEDAQLSVPKRILHKLRLRAKLYTTAGFNINIDILRHSRCVCLSLSDDDIPGSK